MFKIKVFAGIVLYNPNIIRLKENIKKIYKQVDQVFFVDNASNNKQEIMELLKKFNNVLLIENSMNRGAAYALNQIMQKAIEQNASWVLTLDQDSICDEHLIKQYSKFIGVENVGQITCNILDRSFGNEGEYISNKYKEVEYCITSGAFVNTEAYIKCGGFDNVMFIDKVDWDFCLSLKENYYRTIKIPYNGLLHEIGSNAKVIHIGKFKHVLFNHSPMRRYYIARNSIYCAKKHKEISLIRNFAATVFDMMIVLIFEKEKRAKLKQSIKGLIAGFFIGRK